ncbi:hypothetical protein Q5P01_020827 [Channa striata]|uniref:Uncharacterized protein n=1 Tax=Channa striata TaxID=64152 RepID=A0AA88S2Q4_CHASR|nr:hypothetical protein Q5P01_020827 [Channa striata]
MDAAHSPAGQQLLHGHSSARKAGRIVRKPKADVDHRRPAGCRRDTLTTAAWNSEPRGAERGPTSAEIRSRRPCVILGEVGTVRADRCRRWRRSAAHVLTEDVAAAVGQRTPEPRRLITAAAAAAAASPAGAAATAGPHPASSSPGGETNKRHAASHRTDGSENGLRKPAGVVGVFSGSGSGSASVP